MSMGKYDASNLSLSYIRVKLVLSAAGSPLFEQAHAKAERATRKICFFMPLPVKGFEIAAKETHRKQHPCRDDDVIEFEIVLNNADSGKAVVAEAVFGIGNIAHTLAVRSIEQQLYISKMVG